MSEKQLSTKQFVFLIFLSSIAIKMFLLPALILRTFGKNGIWTIAFFIVLEIMNLILLLVVCRRNPDKTFFQIITDAFGKIVSKIIVAVLFAFTFVKTVIVVSEIKVFFVAVMYRDINWMVMAIPLIALVTAFAYRPLRALGRVSEILTPVVLVSTLILCSLLIPEFDIDGILPLFDGGIERIFQGIDKFPLWFGDTTVVLLFMGNIKISKGFGAWTVVAKLLSSVFVAFFCIVLFSSYGNISELIDYGNNISNLTQLSLGSQDYGRFDLLFYCVWLFSVLIKLAVSFIFTVKSARFIVPAGSERLTTVILALALYFVIAVILNNEETTFLLATSAVRYFLCPVVYLYPLLTVITAFVIYKPNYHDLMNKGARNARKTE